MGKQGFCLDEEHEESLTAPVPRSTLIAVKEVERCCRF
jgi:hypothetical protein